MANGCLSWVADAEFLLNGVDFATNFCRTVAASGGPRNCASHFCRTVAMSVSPRRHVILAHHVQYSPSCILLLLLPSLSFCFSAFLLLYVLRSIHRLLSFFLLCPYPRLLLHHMFSVADLNGQALPVGDCFEMLLIFVSPAEGRLRSQLRQSMRA